jgi:hypothetical protein
MKKNRKLNLIQVFKIYSLTSVVFASCVFAQEKNEKNAVTRYVNQATEENAIFYYSKRGTDDPTVEKFSSVRWTSATPQDRSDKLIKFYFANTREVSRSGIKHLACYLGDGEMIKNTFFGTNNEFRSINWVAGSGVQVSEDGLMMGLHFRSQFNREDELELHFRLSHCLYSGKTSILKPELLRQAKLWTPDGKRQVANKKSLSKEEAEFKTEVSRMPAKVSARPEDGYNVNIELKPSDTEIIRREKLTDLPRFVLHDPFEVDRKVAAKEIPPENISKFPWRQISIRQANSETAERFSHELFKYFIEGMIDQSEKAKTNPDLHFIAQNNKTRGWCQMPWLNVGDTGREAIHGLTKERDIEPSEIYPETQNGITGSNWGIGYYNSIACKYLKNVFKSKDHRMTPADWYIGPFPNGSMSFKILFTTAPISLLRQSLTWWSHVSLPAENNRELRPMKLLQIDIALKDTQAVPSDSGTDGWMMSTLYFDQSYDWSQNEWNKEWLKKNPLPQALRPLLNLRPVGIQTGFDQKSFTLVRGSKTNVINHAGGLPDGSLLNGPADNPQGSCMGCHGAAGTFRPMVPLIPGVMSKDEYAAIPMNRKLDFSMQLGFAKRFYQTSVKK